MSGLRPAAYFLAPAPAGGTAWVLHSDRCHGAALDGPAELVGRFDRCADAILPKPRSRNRSWRRRRSAPRSTTWMPERTGWPTGPAGSPRAARR